jgi:metal-sulfur cluster biosynthetic enzyme
MGGSKRGQKHTESYSEKPKEETTLEVLALREDHIRIKMNPKWRGCECVDWINLTYQRFYWPVVLNNVTAFWVLHD